MRRLATTTLFVLSLLLSLAVLNAQQADVTTANTSVPNLIRYSGTLHSAEGAATSSATPQGVTFSIYKQQDGGAAVWQETQNVTADSNGQYNVILGSTTASGLPDDLFSQQEQRWLGVQVQGQPEQARVLLVSVPYAFKAHEADTLGGLPASAFVKAPPADQSSDTAVNAAATATSTTVAAGQVGSKKKLPPGPCNPQAGFLTYWDNTGALCASSLVQIANGNIGIGTANPSEPLDVNGVINSAQWYDMGEPETRILSVGNTGLANMSSTNLYVGWGTGASNSGDTNDNTFVGWNAGQNNSSGNNNTFVGESAGISDTSGKLNTFVGAEAGYAHSTGDTNSFFGFRSGKNNSSGNADTYIGYQAAYSNNGNNNTIVGRSAGFNSKGSNNVCVGVSACYNNTASNDTFLGYSSGVANTSGAGNTFVGNMAGNANTKGGGNTFIGNNAAVTSADSGGNNCCNTIVGNGAAGIGPMAGAANSCFGQRACEADTSGGKNSAYGFLSGYKTTTGSFNSYYGDQSGQNNTVGSYNTFLGISAAGTNFTTGDNNTFVGAFAGDQENNVSNNIEIGNAGPAPGGSNSILIGTETAGVNQTYIAGIYQQQSLTNTRSVVIDATGHLGTGTGSGGGNVVTGPASPCTANYLTRWAGNYTADCTHEYELQSNSYLGVNVGVTPHAALDVNGQSNSGINTTDTRSSYMIGLAAVLSINPIGSNNLFVGPTGSGGSSNTLIGWNAASSNTTGAANTMAGLSAGSANTTGKENSYFGMFAGLSTKDKNDNVYVGFESGLNLDGAQNTFLGAYDGYQLGDGSSSNIFIGYGAGGNNGGTSTASNNNVYIASYGCPAYPCSESGAVRVGTQGLQSVTYVAGIANNNVANTNPVCVLTNGQLGVCGSSSRRFKDEIADMGDSSSKLFQLHPVTYFYKPQYDDGSHALQFGLIAEEVAKVYPEMAMYDKDGQPSGVRYQLLAPMLLNELQKEHKVVMEQQEELQTQLQQIKAQRQELDTVKRELQTQNASLQERLQKLESYVETQMKTASDMQPTSSSGAKGGLQ